MREAEEVEVLGLALPPAAPIRDGPPPELDQPRLVRMQLQSKLRQTLTKVFLETASIRLVFEAEHEVVRVTHDDHVTARVPTTPLLGPQVEGVVQVDVGQQGRRRRTLRASARWTILSSSDAIPSGRC